MFSPNTVVAAFGRRPSRPYATYPALPEVAALVVYDSRKPRRRAPRLTQAERADSLIIELLGTDPEHQKNCARVRHRQRLLRQHTSIAGWQRYLALEEAEVERLGYALERVALYALTARRRPKPRSR